MNTRMTEEAPDVRPLGQRLIEISFPEADGLASRVIWRYRGSTGAGAPAAGGSRRGRGRRRRYMVPAGLVAAALIGAVLAATPAGPALAGTPLVNPVVTKLLDIFGLSTTADHVVPLAVSSISAGQTIAVVGGYADSGRTVLLVRVS